MTDSRDQKTYGRSKTQRDAYNIALSALLASLAMILSYVEFLLPFNFGIPGVKLGLANLVIIVALYGMNFKYALTVNVLRIFLSALLFTGLNALFYSFAGGMISLIVMFLLKKTGLFSMIGVSMAGGAAHNLGQLIVAAFMVSNLNMFLYFPVLLMAGMFTGIGIGVVAYIFCKRMPANVLPGIRTGMNK